MVTLLASAAHSAVGVLLRAGANVDCTDTEGRTALRAAAWGGHEDIVATLLEHGADVNRADTEGRTALIAAAYMGHREIVALLLAHGAHVDHTDVDGRTALSVAALCVPAMAKVLREEHLEEGRVLQVPSFGLEMAPNLALSSPFCPIPCLGPKLVSIGSIGSAFCKRESPLTPATKSTLITLCNTVFFPGL
uniref:Uncharacterized protein n=1 Tax=Anolis carolinensis TaxID=28377 RepID=A0A803TDC5_ANOCA